MHFVDRQVHLDGASLEKQIATERAKIHWGFLLSKGGEHKKSACEKCSFFGRPCHLEMTQPLDTTMLKLQSVSSDHDSEESLLNLFKYRIRANPRQVAVGFDDDIESCINCRPEDRSQQVERARGKRPMSSRRGQILISVA